MSKRTNFASLIGEKPSATAAGGGEPVVKAPPTTALMHTIIGNPGNPRGQGEYSTNDPEFEELMVTLREVGQLQPVAVVSREVFLRLKPEHTKAVGVADWVVVNGNRRFAAARQLGWTRLDIKVQDHLGDGKGLLDEAVIIENIHRKAIEPCKEAAFLQVLVEKYGSQEKVASRIGKSQMYVSHRLSLLRLAPDLQRRVDAGLFKLKAARELAARTADHEEQHAQYAELQRQAQRPRTKPAAAVASEAVAPAVAAPEVAVPVAVAPVVVVPEAVSGAVAPAPVQPAPVAVAPVAVAAVPVASAPVVEEPVVAVVPVASAAPVVKPRSETAGTGTGGTGAGLVAESVSPIPGASAPGGSGSTLPLLSALLEAGDRPEDLVQGLRALTDETYRQRVAELLLEHL
ncbi:ParB/RepB/Spo0J family partition protein [Streptomyces sp. NPDC051567]|uniref:ParB/RepB/Spo0J family partition protein n=1 Tax=Streptomyces sp. NPDC051567 TaxID=3365660 RepID=UPI0037A12113